MKEHLPKFFLRSLILSIVASIFLGGCATLESQKISTDTLNSQLNNPDLIIIDVRQERSWQKSELKIQGAVRENPNNVASWADKYAKDTKIVLYCS